MLYVFERNKYSDKEYVEINSYDYSYNEYKEFNNATLRIDYTFEIKLLFFSFFISSDMQL